MSISIWQKHSSCLRNAELRFIKANAPIKPIKPSEQLSHIQKNWWDNAKTVKWSQVAFFLNKSKLN